MCPSSTSSSEPALVVTTHEGTLHVPETFARGQRATAWAVVALFLACIVGTGVVDTLWPVPLPKLIGMEATEDAAQRAKASWIDGTREQLLEKDLRVTSRVRSVVGPPYTLALYRWLHEGGRDAVIGRDGWVFLTSRASMGGKWNYQEFMERAAAQLATLDRALAAQGTRLIVVPIPRKEFVYLERLPRGVQPRPELESAFVRALAERAVETVDLTRLFQEHAGEQLYFSTGTHWTERGELLAAEELARVCGLAVPEAQRSTRIVPGKSRPPDIDALMWIGLGREDAMESVADQRVETLELVDRAGEPFAFPAAELGPVVLTGTSFSANRGFVTWLEHFLDRPLVNVAQPGADGVSPLLGYLRRAAGVERPRIVILEIPLHMTFAANPFASVAQIVSNDPPPQLVECASRALRTEPGALGQPLALDATPRKLSLVPYTALAYSGDGSLYFRLRGELTGGDAQVEVNTLPLVVSATWRAGAREVLLPWTNEYASVEPATIAVRSATGAQLVLESVEIVGAFDEQRAEPLTVAAPESTGQGWSVRMSDPGGRTLDRRDLLAIDFAWQPGFDRPLELELACAGRAPITLRFEKLVGYGQIVLSLGAFAGATLEHVKLSGGGPTPTSAAIARARLLPPAAAPR